MNDLAAHIAACARLRSVALQQMDPEWLSDLPAPLFAQLRGSVLGLRLLARTLTEGAAPELFAEALWAMPADADWLFWSKAALDEVALDLAALALSGPISATVKRDAVLRLKRVLHEARYALALSEPSANARSAVFNKALAADETLQRYFFAHGYAELIGYAATLNPACAARIRLSLPPAQVPSLTPCLDPQRVAEHLDQLRVANAAPADAPEQVANG